MQDYRQYDTTDFISDDSFRAWVFDNSELDKIFWEQWIQLNPDKRGVVLESKNQMLSIYKAFDNITDDEVAFEINHLNEQIDTSDRSKWIFNWSWKNILCAAASIFIVLGIVWFKNTNNESITPEMYLTNIKHTELKWQTVENTGNTQMTINIKDGSTIVLQKNSKLIYPETFAQNERKVILVGEAFFEIAKGPSKPFYVFANKLVTKVLGTSFLIRANANESTVNVVVKTGSVSVFENTIQNLEEQTSHKTLEGLVLTPNQQVIFNKSDRKIVRSLIDSPELLKMPIQQQVFIFDKTSISEVFKTLEKAYGITIVYDTEIMKNCYLTASLNDEPLFEKLNLICKTLDAKYELVDAKIVIYTNGCI